MYRVLFFCNVLARTLVKDILNIDSFYFPGKTVLNIKVQKGDAIKEPLFSQQRHIEELFLIP